MNIADMHVYFRQYAQQMGMQNVRAIIPDQIDILINTAIVDIVNKIVRDNVGVRNDKLIKDYSKIGDVDALKTLCTHAFSQIKAVTEYRTCQECLTYSNDDNIADMMYAISSTIAYLKYNQNTQPVAELTVLARIMSNTDIQQSINDDVLKPKINSPIIYINSPTDNALYLPKKTLEYINNSTGNIILWNNYMVIVRVDYLKYPTKVSITTDTNCDLPESLHVDIVKYAAELYKNIVSKGSYYQPQQATTATNK